jgi:RNA polymerase sigma factor (sigma-70 family)
MDDTPPSTGVAPPGDEGGTRDHLPTHVDLRAALNTLLEEARPRLLRQAVRLGVTPEAADDVVQETLIEAWASLDHLRTPARFDAWLAAVCRNRCLMHLRADRTSRRRFAREPLSLLTDTVSDEAEAARDLPDPGGFDPADELDRRDRHALLDRALAHLPESARAPLQLCYLDELPQRQAAQRLGLTLSALESRLHRARAQLRAVLRDALRDEAEAHGLLLDRDVDRDVPSGWRDSRIWCNACGRHRLRGAFVPLPSGGVDLRMRCPGCGFEVNSGGTVPLDGIRSFRPALTRMMRYAVPYLTSGLATGEQPCPVCGSPRRMWLAGPDDALAVAWRWRGLVVALLCPRCDVIVNASVAAAFWFHPAMRAFIDAHPRAVAEPETLTEYQGRAAVRVRLSDIASATRLTLLADRRTLDVLATLRE